MDDETRDAIRLNGSSLYIVSYYTHTYIYIYTYFHVYLHLRNTLVRTVVSKYSVRVAVSEH